MLSLFLIFAIISIIGMSISLLLKSRFEYGMPMAILFIIIVLYLFGLFDALIIGVYSIYSAAASSFVLLIYYTAKKKVLLFKQLITPGFALFLLFFIFMWWAHRGRYLINTDALTHWGLSVKNMMITDKIPTRINSSIINIQYPPAISLFQYFWMKIYGYYGEGNLFRALSVIGFSMTLPIFAKSTWKKWYISFVMFFVVLLSYVCFDESYFINLQVDVSIGIIIAFIFIVYFGLNESIIKKCIYIVPALVVVTLTKYTSLIPALITTIVILLDILLKKKNTPQVKSESRKNKRNILFVVILLSSVIFAFLSWIMFYRIHDNKYKQHVLKNCKEFQYINQTKKEDDVSELHASNAFFTSLNAAVVKLSTVNKNGTPTIFGKSIIFKILCIIIALLALRYMKKNKDTELRPLLLILAGGFLFFAGRIFIYIYGHSLSVAQTAKGIERYLSLYNSTIIIYCIYKIRINIPQKTKSAVIYLSIIITGIILLSNPESLKKVTINAKESIAYSNDVRIVYYCTNSINEYVDINNHNVYFISSADIGSKNDYAFYHSRYNTAPLRLSESDTYSKKGSMIYPWTLGPARKDWGDPTNISYTVDQWQEILYYGFDYVYIYMADDRFIDDYGRIFESTDDIERNSVFFIEKAEGKVKLIKVS